MNVDEILSAVRTFAYNNSENDDLHGFKHVERVLKLCVQIGTALNANLLTIKIAALLHDVGRIYEKKNDAKNHAELSAEKAEKFLQKTNFNINIDDIENIIHSIRAHSFSNKIKPKTILSGVQNGIASVNSINLFKVSNHCRIFIMIEGHKIIYVSAQNRIMYSYLRKNSIGRYCQPGLLF